MTCVGKKKSSEFKDDFVLITMFTGTQANAYNQTKFLQGGYMDILRLYPLMTINQSIDLQLGIRHLSMIHVCRHPSQCIQPQLLVNQSINLQVQR